ncbi:hypothetical protein A9Q84_16620 [Halobacteriovorax marinus]|uniref:Uncharacterized protein n=1 Tax=Halobacteriovorax marinus TaxID=97084 RepID=A0A1Y5F4F2_9BACT|nr:hypothetical protein A9Q84_16620 [Halobacteriovorax marinus]
MQKKILAALFLLLSINIQCQEVLKLSFSQIVDTPDQAVGAEILKRVYKSIQIPVSFMLLSGERALIQSSGGFSDGEVHRIWKVGEVYPNLLRVPTPINYIEPSVFSIKTYQIKSCEDLRHLRIGIVRGVKHAEICTKGFKKLKILKHSLELIRVLNEREVDVIITARFNGIIQVNKLGYQKVQALNPPLSKRPLYHYVHKKHGELIPRINAAIIKMRNSGEMIRIRKEAMEKLSNLAAKY